MGLQELLDKEAQLSNELLSIREQIRNKRQSLPGPPPCFGTDDCSTMILISCPWRFDCGDSNG